MGGSSKDGAMGGGVLRDDGALLDIVLRDTLEENISQWEEGRSGPQKGKTQDSIRVITEPLFMLYVGLRTRHQCQSCGQE